MQTDNFGEFGLLKLARSVLRVFMTPIRNLNTGLQVTRHAP